MEREVYASDITGRTITGPRYLMEIRRIQDDGTIDGNFGVRAYDMDDSDLKALELDDKGRRYSVRGRRSKEAGRV